MKSKIAGVIVLLSLVVWFSGCIEEEGGVVVPTPTPIPSPSPSKEIPGLSYVQIFVPVWTNWDRDPEPDGLEFQILFYDEKGSLIFFRDIPVTVEVKIYSERWDNEKGEFVRNKLVYHGNVTITSHEDKIRIPKEHIAPDPTALDAFGNRWKYGQLEIAVHTPVQGTFYAKWEDLVQIYD